MSTKISKEAHTFYFAYAMLLASRKYMQDLMENKFVAYQLKQVFSLLVNRITDLDNRCKLSLDKDERNQWHREWSDRDYEVFASVFSMMNDMSDEKRNILEDFATELSKGNVRVEIEEGQTEQAINS